MEYKFLQKHFVAFLPNKKQNLINKANGFTINLILRYCNFKNYKQIVKNIKLIERKYSLFVNHVVLKTK